MSIPFFFAHLHRGIGLMVLQWRACFYPCLTLHLQTKRRNVRGSSRRRSDLISSYGILLKLLEPKALLVTLNLKQKEPTWTSTFCEEKNPRVGNLINPHHFIRCKFHRFNLKKPADGPSPRWIEKEGPLPGK